MRKEKTTRIGQFLFEREGKYKPNAIELNGLNRIDKIDFSMLDANVSILFPGDQAFAYSFPTLTANSVNYFYDGINTIVQADTDGNTATAEFQIQLTGNVALTATDFIL